MTCHDLLWAVSNVVLRLWILRGVWSELLFTYPKKKFWECPTVESEAHPVSALGVTMSCSGRWWSEPFWVSCRMPWLLPVFCEFVVKRVHCFRLAGQTQTVADVLRRCTSTKRLTEQAPDQSTPRLTTSVGRMLSTHREIVFRVRVVSCVMCRACEAVRVKVASSVGVCRICVLLLLLRSVARLDSRRYPHFSSLQLGLPDFKQVLLLLILLTAPLQDSSQGSCLRQRIPNSHGSASPSSVLQCSP